MSAKNRKTVFEKKVRGRQTAEYDNTRHTRSETRIEKKVELGYICVCVCVCVRRGGADNSVLSARQGQK